VVAWFPGADHPGERLELSRLLQLSRLQHGLFLLAVSLSLAGLLLLATGFASGGRVTGVGMVALAWWLLDLPERGASPATVVTTCPTLR
jgi:hypothetical protein